MKKVSIIIPVYNREGIIAQTIASVLKQTYQYLEIIICDNRSTDNTWNILQEYAEKDSRIKVFRNEENVGPVLNWGECLKQVSGDYCKILWSDDLISENFIEETLGELDADTAFVISAIEIFDNDGVFERSLYKPDHTYTSAEYLEDILLYQRNGFPVSPGCALFRTKDLIDAFVVDIENTEGLTFKRFGAGNDLLFYLLTAVKYKYIKTTGKCTSFFRSHKDSITVSNNLIKYYEWARWYFIKHSYKELTGAFRAKVLFSALKHKELLALKRSIPRTSPFHVINFGAKRFLSK